MKNQGISLISLIITIIVVIILAAIAIFSGFGAVDSASLADFAQKYDNVQMAVLNTYGNKLAETAISGDGYNSAQIYGWICNEENVYTELASDALGTIQFTKIGMKAPTVSGSTEWKLTSTGKVVFPKGFEYKNGNEAAKFYVTPDVTFDAVNPAEDDILTKLAQ